jgi:hypothetical protein
VEDQPGTEPEIVFARQPHSAGQEERHLLAPRRVETKVGPREIGAVDLESLGGNQFR